MSAATAQLDALRVLLAIIADTAQAAALDAAAQLLIDSLALNVAVSLLALGAVMRDA